MPKGMSIHIGLNEIDEAKYGTKGELKNCENDARAMAALAEASDFSVAPILLTREATSEKVTALLQRAAGELTEGDVLLLTYAGHGSQVTDRNGDEPDGRDETWVLYDRQLVDDELYHLYAQFAPGVRVLVLSDSCHSGTVARELPSVLSDSELERGFSLGGTGTGSQPLVRTLPTENQLLNYRRDQEVYDAIQRDLPPAERQDIPAAVLLISGCQDNQTSSDGTGVNGLFTETLLKTWDNGGFRGDYTSLHRHIVRQMPPYQTPNLYQVGTGCGTLAGQQPFTI